MSNFQGSVSTSYSCLGTLAGSSTNKLKFVTRRSTRSTCRHPALFRKKRKEKYIEHTLSSLPPTYLRQKTITDATWLAVASISVSLWAGDHLTSHSWLLFGLPLGEALSSSLSGNLPTDVQQLINRLLERSRQMAVYLIKYGMNIFRVAHIM